jgi:hypothetical protein
MNGAAIQDPSNKRRSIIFDPIILAGMLRCVTVVGDVVVRELQ